MSILSQSGALVGTKIKAENDDRTAVLATKAAEHAGARTTSNDAKDVVVKARAEDIDGFSADCNAGIAKLEAEFQAEIDYITENTDAAALDSIKEIYDAMIAQDAAKDLGIVNYFSDSNASLDAHQAEYGDYAEFVAGYDA